MSDKSTCDRVDSHQRGVINDFCDALIEAKEEAIAEEKESAPHLTDQNLSLVVLNLFFGMCNHQDHYDHQAGPLIH